MAVSQKTKQIVWERSGGLCERRLANGRQCMAPAVDQHHIIPKGMGGRKGVMKVLFDKPDNLMNICRSCHSCVSMWNEDATGLVPGKEFRTALKAGDTSEALRILKGGKDGNKETGTGGTAEMS